VPGVGGAWCAGVGGGVVARISAINGLALEVLDTLSAWFAAASRLVEEHACDEGLGLEAQGVPALTVELFGSQGRESESARAEAAPSLVGMKGETEKALSGITGRTGAVDVPRDHGQGVVWVVTNRRNHRLEDLEQVGATCVDIAVVAGGVQIAVETVSRGSRGQVVVIFDALEDVSERVGAGGSD
jgi:hypothetical protein